LEICIFDMLTCVAENLQTAAVENNILPSPNPAMTPSPIDGGSNFVLFDAKFFRKSSMQVADSIPHESYQTILRAEVVLFVGTISHE